MSDILSSISILVGILTALFSLFFPSIDEILNLNSSSAGNRDNTLNYRRGKSVRNTKVFPLLFGAILLTIVFIPELINQLKIAWLVFRVNGNSIIWNTYDTASAAYIVTSIFAITLTISICYISFRFFVHLKTLRDY